MTAITFTNTLLLEAHSHSLQVYSICIYLTLHSRMRIVYLTTFSCLYDIIKSIYRDLLQLPFYIALINEDKSNALLAWGLLS